MIDVPKELGKQVNSGEALKCPLCSKDSPDQPMASFGDFRHILFCPHCDITVELVLRDKGVSWKRFIK
jgi:hypothetical protein